MANRILTALGWEERVRERLGVSAGYLPDASIQKPDIVVVAEARVIRAFPTYASVTGDNRVFLEAAAVCQCALLLIPSMQARLPSRQKGPGVDVELTVNWDEKRETIEAEYAEHIGMLQGGDDTSTATGFWLSGPSR